MIVITDGGDLYRLARNFLLAMRGSKDRLYKAVDRASRLTVGSSKKAATRMGVVDTGELRENIKVTDIGSTGLEAHATVASTVPYAVFPHEGWSTSTRYGRRPFLEDGVLDVAEQLDDIMEQAGTNLAFELIKK